jgi:hypothetical protein
LTLRSKVKVPRRSLRYATHCLMVMHPHTKYILFKTQLVDLEVKGQGPTKIITVHDTPPYGHAPTYQISLTKTICLPSLCNTSHFNVIFKQKYTRVSLVEQELVTLPFLVGFLLARSSVFCVVFCRLLFVLLCFFFLPLYLSVLLRFTLLTLVSTNSSINVTFLVIL